MGWCFDILSCLHFKLSAIASICFQLAGVMAVEVSQGLEVPFHPGRKVAEEAGVTFFHSLLHLLSQFIDVMSVLLQGSEFWFWFPHQFGISSQSRADLLCLGLAMTNILTGLAWLSIRPQV